MGLGCGLESEDDMDSGLLDDGDCEGDGEDGEGDEDGDEDGDDVGVGDGAEEIRESGDEG